MKEIVKKVIEILNTDKDRIGIVLEYLASQNTERDAQLNALLDKYEDVHNHDIPCDDFDAINRLSNEVNDIAVLCYALQLLTEEDS